MSNVIETPTEPAVAVGPPSEDPFAAAAAEGPFGFKPDRNRPIEPHFDGFGRLTPEQARQVLDVRDGRRPQCLLRLPTESVLVEHAGQGYCDPATGRQWGYRVRRVGRDGPPDEPVQQPIEPPSVVASDAPTPPPAGVPAPPERFVPPPTVVPQWAVPEPEVAIDQEEEPSDPADEWAAPARSPRAVALADPAERTALVRVLVLWFVIVLLSAECVTLVAMGR